MTQTLSSSRIHVVVGTPWRDAVIKHLQPRSPYQPWSQVLDARAGDGVAVVFDSEPRLVLTDIGVIGPDGDVGAAIAALHHSWLFNPAVPVSALPAEPVGLVVGEAVQELLTAVDEVRFREDRDGRFGDTSMVAARVLLESGGRCTGCDVDFDLTREDAREAVQIRTVASSTDWPAALCLSCVEAMQRGAYRTFLDFKFSRHPTCPRCGGRRTRRAQFGMPVSFDVPPWVALMGCCVTDDQWSCDLCSYSW